MCTVCVCVLGVGGGGAGSIINISSSLNISVGACSPCKILFKLLLILSESFLGGVNQGLDFNLLTDFVVM